jgi:hypothetical protein
LIPKHSQQQQQLKYFATIITTKISNVTPEIQVANNIILFLTTLSLKNVVASSKKKNSTRRSLIKKTNFHNVQKFPPFSVMTIQIPRPPKDHCQQKMVKTHPPTHLSFSPPLHFENIHHLSLSFFHPLRFLNFDYLNHFKHACSTKVCFK